MSGLLALLDDVASIAKMAAASVDDVVSQALKASSKAAGAVIDDAAVTPKFVHGFSAERELPIVWKIARGSLINKLAILLPVAMLLSSFAPWAIAPLLMLGGAYLCFEGAEKVWHALHPHPAEPSADPAQAPAETDRPEQPAAHLEEKKVAGAIKTDFILSAEIMTITLAALPPELSIWFQASALAVAGIIITIAVYGAVALIVKADDIGLHMAQTGNGALTRRIGLAIVRGMPGFMKFLVIVGTAAMIWVGGSIIIHALAEMGLTAPYDMIHGLAHMLAGEIAALEWAIIAVLDGLIGLGLGLALIKPGAGLSQILTRLSASG
ncbi:MAG: DUF808 domain-containing protein [Pseudomonadota bacterium]